MRVIQNRGPAVISAFTSVFFLFLSLDKDKVYSPAQCIYCLNKLILESEMTHLCYVVFKYVN